MESENTKNSINDLLAAMADGELDMRENPDALVRIAQDPKAADRIAYQQQLREACAKTMDGPEMKCPSALAAKLRAMGIDEQAHDADEADAVESVAVTNAPANSTPASSTPADYQGPAVVGRIGGISRWVPSAVAAVLLIAAAVVFTNANPGSGGVGVDTASFLSIDKVDRFGGRHGDCSLDLSLLKGSEKFGDATEFNQLPGKLADHFKASTDGLQLSLDGIGYAYQLTGACPLPGKGAVHVVYRHKDNPSKAISLWVMPVKEQHKGFEEGQVYSKASEDDVMHPVIYWRQGDMLYYLVGDSIEDANRAVQELRQTA